MKLLILPVALLLAACDVKVGSKTPTLPVDPKPVTCARGIHRDIPQAFQKEGTAIGAVRAEDCGSLVVGTDPQGDLLIAKYDANGVQDVNFGVQKPLQARYGRSGVRIQRLAMINNGFFAFGTYGRGSEPRSLFAFRFLDSGFLDLAYGPLRDGVAKANADARYNLISVGAPSVEGDLIRLRNRVEDIFAGTEIEREQLLLAAGSQALPKDLTSIPATCELLNHTAIKGETQIQIAQSGCAEMVFRASGPLGSDALTVAMNGTTYFSNFLGEMRWSYEPRAGQPGVVLISRDGLGFVKKEFANFVQGQTSLCGTTVDSRRRYLVFSRKTPQNPEWLTDCWFL